MMVDSTNLPIYTYYRQSKDVTKPEPLTLRTMKYTNPSPGVALLTWDTPRTLNSITFVWSWEFIMALEHFKRDQNIEVVILTNNGRAFSSGGNFFASPKMPFEEDILQGYIEKGGYEDTRKADMAQRVPTMAVHYFPKIFICAVDGVCVGGGSNIATCWPDICVMAESVTLKWPFVEVGLVSELSSSYVFPRALGLAQAKKYLLLGEIMTAQEAGNFGLAQYVVPDSQVLSKALEVAKVFTDNPNKNAILAGKRILNSQFTEDLEEATKTENRFMADRVADPEFKKAIQRLAMKLKNKKKKPKKRSKL